MTEAEWEMLDLFLARLGDYQSNSGCNDLLLRDTPGNREMTLTAEKATDCLDGKLHFSGDKILTCDFILLAHLRGKLKALRDGGT